MAAQKASLEQFANLATVDVEDGEGWEEMDDDDDTAVGAAAHAAAAAEDGSPLTVQPETLALVREAVGGVCLSVSRSCSGEVVTAHSPHSYRP